MKLCLTAFILTISSTVASALPTQVICSGVDISSVGAQPRSGTARISFRPFVVSWQETGGAQQVLYNSNVICGSSIEDQAQKPTCFYRDSSDRDYRPLLFDAFCSTKDNSATARAQVMITRDTGGGTFECRSNFAGDHSIRIRLDECE